MPRPERSSTTTAITTAIKAERISHFDTEIRYEGLILAYFYPPPRIFIDPLRNFYIFSAYIGILI